MNLPTYSSLLLKCCIAAVLFLSLWLSSAQDFLAQDVLETSDIVLTLDADAHADDAFEQFAMISHVPTAIFVSLHSRYPQQLSQTVLSNCFPPPDRPPAQSV